ncbi:hypothetical protein C0995_013369 [Termitomyces sp. Mi166|nr:hypothetical protein C0995_013369 [Termitomyces sp. Mi166\
MRNLWLLLLVRGVALSYPLHATLAEGGRKHRPVAEPGSPEFWFHMTVSAILVLLGGVFAGLTLGLMGLDDLHLRVLATSSEDPYEQQNAKQGAGQYIMSDVGVHPDRSAHSSEADVKRTSLDSCGSAPVQCDTLIGYLSFNSEKSFLRQFVFAMDLPSAPDVLLLFSPSCGSSSAPIAYPIAKLLDWALGGKEHNTYKKAELKSFLQFHRTGEEPLRDDEINILNGVLELNTKKVETIMTRIEDTVTLSSDTILDHAKVDSILLSGYSRFPVHAAEDPTAFVGLLLIKKLLTYDPAKALPVSAFPLSILPEAHPSINCFQALDYFQTGRAHLLLISKTPGQAGGAIGVITLEDVIEEIISEEIVDETDRYEDNQSKRSARRRVTNAAVMRGIVERQRRSDSFSNRSEASPLLGSTPKNYDSTNPVPPLPKSALGQSPTNADSDS